MTGRVLVTGATGFIGRHAVPALLERGFEVHAVARRPPADTGRVTWHEGDLLADPAAAVADAAPTHLLHLAWYAEPGKFWAGRENAHWVAATVRLAEAFGAAGGQRAVMAGTCAEYDWAAPEAAAPLREDAPLRPATLYGISKDAARRVSAPLVPALAWGRIFFLYGPGEDPRRLVSGVARGLVAGERVPTTDGSQLRDFLHVADVGAAFAAIVDSDVEGPVNVAGGDPLAVMDIAQMLAEAAGRPDLLDVGALPQREGEPALIAGDVSVLRDAVGFVPAWTPAAGLAATLQWWREAAG